MTAGCDVYVLESELDAAVLHELGYTAVSVISASQKQFEPEVLKKLSTARRIFLVGDNDAAGVQCMDNLARLLPVEKVYRMPLPYAKDVGELVPEVQKDEDFLGDFHARWAELLKDATASWVTHNIPFIGDLSSEPQEWIVDRFLPMHGYLLLSAKYGGCKSLTALVSASGIASGTSVFGRKVLRPIPVLYIDRENPQGTIGDRCARLGIPENQIHYWGDWFEGMETPDLEHPRLMEFMIREKGIIIFDSLTDWLKGENENDTSQMTQIALRLRRLARIGSGVIVLHHNNKQGATRGATSIAAGSDMAMSLTKNALTNVVEIRSERFRMCANWELDVKFEFGERFTVRVLKDKSETDAHKNTSEADLATVTGILTDYHDKNQGASMNQTQVLKMMHPHRISKDRGLALLATGFQKKIWVHEAGLNNAVLYRLCGRVQSGAESDVE